MTTGKSKLVGRHESSGDLNARTTGELERSEELERVLHDYIGCILPIAPIGKVWQTPIIRFCQFFLCLHYQ
jgi:hypothetical protein